MEEKKIVKSVKVGSAVAKVMVNIEDVTQEINKATDVKKEYVNQLKSDMNENGIYEYLLDDGGEKNLSAVLTSKISANIDNAKVLQKLDKKQIAQIADVVYVCDIDGLKDLLKRYPELKKEFKKIITKVETVNDTKLDYALKNGIVTIQDLEDAYTIKEVQALTVRRKKK